MCISIVKNLECGNTIDFRIESTSMKRIDFLSKPLAKIQIKHTDFSIISNDESVRAVMMSCHDELVHGFFKYCMHLDVRHVRMSITCLI